MAYTCEEYVSIRNALARGEYIVITDWGSWYYWQGQEPVNCNAPPPPPPPPPPGTETRNVLIIVAGLAIAYLALKGKLK